LSPSSGEGDEDLSADARGGPRHTGERVRGRLRHASAPGPAGAAPAAEAAALTRVRENERRRSALAGPSPPVNGVEYPVRPLRVVRRDDHDGEAEALALHADPLGVIDVQVDAERRRVLRRRVAGEVGRFDDTLVPRLVDDAFQGNAEAGEPAA